MGVQKSSGFGYVLLGRNTPSTLDPFLYHHCRITTTVRRDGGELIKCSSMAQVNRERSRSHVK